MPPRAVQPHVVPAWKPKTCELGLKVLGTLSWHLRTGTPMRLLAAASLDTAR